MMDSAFCLSSDCSPVYVNEVYRAPSKHITPGGSGGDEGGGGGRRRGWGWGGHELLTARLCY